MNGARLIGVGVGPGDPGLVTLNAIAALRQADVVAHFAKAGNASNARTIAACHFKEGIEELPLHYPVTTEIPKADAAYRDAIRTFYDGAARAIASRLDQGRIVAVIAFKVTSPGSPGPTPTPMRRAPFIGPLSPAR